MFVPKHHRPSFPKGSPTAIVLALVVVFGCLLIRPGKTAIAADDGGSDEPSGRRLEVLFLGSENISNHDPIARFRVIRRALGKRGINFTYTETLDALTPDNLARFDVLLIFANHYTIDKGTQGKALLDFAREGGGTVLLHCAAGCFRDSQFDEYVELLGAQFDRHGDGVFRPEIVNHDHPVMRGYEGFEAWDETYVHKRHGTNRTILQERDGEPWTWVKHYADGRVFYTASGHDHRVWEQPNYHDLLYRAIRWTAGDGAAAELDALDLPDLSYRPAAVPKDPDNPVGPNNELQLPLSPDESMKLAQVPPGFELRLFAAEPMVVNPIAINWDERGRLWVVEALNYPHDLAPTEPADRIKILEDTDGDGRADTVTLFADGLNLCTSVLPVVGGAIATEGTNMVFLVDADGDGRAEDKRVIFSGIKLDDTHAGVSNLRYGFDNWIYATVGYSGVDTVIGGERHEFAMAVFRFRADGSELQVVQHTSNNTWGLGQTEQGDVVGSTANNNPSWYVSIPDRIFAAAHRPSARVPSADNQDLLYPVTGDYFQNSPKEHSSSGAGHAIYTGRLFPEDWWNRRAFICEPPMHLVAAPRFENDGTRFHATHFEDNLYASADAWSAPVAAEVGPEGAVWIADWYSPVLNHNVYRPDHQRRGPGNAYVTPDRDCTHGRIYRVLPQGTSPATPPVLDTAGQQLEALSHSNLFWRLTAQRLLVQRANANVATRDRLRNLASSNRSPASIHALRALAGLVGADDATLGSVAIELARSKDRGVAVAALSVLPRVGEHRELLLSLVHDAGRHPMIRKAAALALVELPADPNLGADMAVLVESDDTVEHHLATAARLVCLRHPEGFLRRMLEAGEAPRHPLLERAFNEALEVLQRDKDYVSTGLLALANASSSAVAGRIVEAAGVVHVETPTVELSPSAQRGKGVYLMCVACHQPSGEGVPGAFPPLAGSPRVLGDEEVLIKIVLKGLQGPLTSQGRDYQGLMPGHEAALTDRQIADVLNFVRASWGNGAGDIEETAVKEIRATVKDRRQPWTINELEP